MAHLPVRSRLWQCAPSKARLLRVLCVCVCVCRIHHQKSRYIYDLYYKRKAISRGMDKRATVWCGVHVD